MFELAEKGLMRVVQRVLNFFCLFIEHQVYTHCTCTFAVRSFEIYKAVVSVFTDSAVFFFIFYLLQNSSMLVP